MTLFYFIISQMLDFPMNCLLNLLLDYCDLSPWPCSMAWLCSVACQQRSTRSWMWWSGSHTWRRLSMAPPLTWSISRWRAHTWPTQAWRCHITLTWTTGRSLRECSCFIVSRCAWCTYHVLKYSFVFLLTVAKHLCIFYLYFFLTFSFSLTG